MKKDNNVKGESGAPSQEIEFLREVINVFGEIPALIIDSGVNTDFAVDEALSRVGQLLNASRVYVMQDEKSGSYLRNTHEWVNANIGPAMFSWPLYDYEYDVPSLKEALSEERVLFRHTKDLPPDLNCVLSKQGVQSVLLAPLIRDGKRAGFVGCDFCVREIEFTNELSKILLYLSALVSIALERKQYQTIRGKLNTVRLAISDVEPIIADMEEEETPVPRNARHVSLQDAERRIIVETLEMYNGNKLKTAKHLGLTWPSLDRRCKKMGIEVRKK